MESTKRDYYFDNLKGFLIFTVVLGHILENISNDMINSEFLVLIIYLFHMPLFTFVSGYFAKKSKRTTQEKVIEMAKIYVLAQIAYTIFYAFIINVPDTKLKILYPNWTLWYLLSLTVWYVIADYIKDNKKWFIGSIVVALLIGFDTTIGGFASVSRTIFFLPFFIAGYSMDKSFVDNIMKRKWQILIGATIIIGVTYIFRHIIPIDALYEYCDYKWEFEVVKQGFIIRAFHYLAAFVVGAGVMALTSRKKNFWAFYGKNSLVVYLIHAAVIKVVGDFRIVVVYNTTSAIVYGIFVLVIVAIITHIYVKVSEKLKKRQVVVKREIECTAD